MIVLFADTPRFHRQWRDEVAQQLTGAFIKTNDGKPGIIGLFVQIQNILHAREIFALYLRETPPLLLPRFEVVFLKPGQRFCGKWYPPLPDAQAHRPTTARTSVHPEAELSRRWRSNALPLFRPVCTAARSAVDHIKDRVLPYESAAGCCESLAG